MWWAVFPGIAVGVFQVYAMRVYMRGLGAGGRGLRRRVATGLVNALLVLGLIIGFACVSPEALLWSAGGMCGAMILLALALFVRSIDN